MWQHKAETFQGHKVAPYDTGQSWPAVFVMGQPTIKMIITIIIFLFWGRNVAQRCLNTFLFLLLFSCALCVGRRWSMCSTSTCPPAPACWTWHWPTTTSTAAAAYPRPSTEKWLLLTAAPRQSTTTRSTTHKRLHRTMNSWKARQPDWGFPKDGTFLVRVPRLLWNTKHTETPERYQRSTHFKNHSSSCVCFWVHFIPLDWQVACFVQSIVMFYSVQIVRRLSTNPSCHNGIFFSFFLD